MKLAVVGSRNLKNIDLGQYLSKYEDITEIVSGGAIGVDTLAEEWAKVNKIPTTIFYPDYKRYGKRAPLVRNDQIVEKADEIIAFWDGKSRGTMYTIKAAKKAGKRVKLIDLSKDPKFSQESLFE